jgi:chromosome condensin MukBEF MukE localization factor
VRSIYRHHWSKLTKAEHVMDAAQALERLGWLRFVENSSSGGRPGSPVIRLHPDLRVGDK